MPARKALCAMLLLLTALAPGCAARGAAGPEPAGTRTATPAGLPPGDARALIRGWLEANRPDFNMDALGGLSETDFGIPGLGGATGAQYYTLGSYAYILYNGSVCEVYRLEPQSAVLADADGDGGDEAVFVGDVGSGLYIRVVTVVKSGVAYRLNLNDSDGSAGYRLERAADGSAALIRLTYGENARVRDETPAGTVRLAGGKVTLAD